MTLRRKGIISVPQGNILYGLLLIIGMAIIVRDFMDRGILGLGITLGNISALIRFEIRLNKYALWTLVALFLQWIASASGDRFLKASVAGRNVWHVASVISSGMLLIAAARRQHQMMIKI